MLPRVAHPREGPTWITQLIRPIQWFSAEGNSAQGGIWHCLQTVWIFIVWRGKGEWCCRHQWVEARRTEKHTKMHRTAPTTKTSLSQDVGSLRLRTSGLIECSRRTPVQHRCRTALVWAGRCCPPSSGKGSIIWSDPASVCLGEDAMSRQKPLHTDHRVTRLASVMEETLGDTVQALGLPSLALSSPGDGPSTHSSSFQFYIGTLKTL